MDLDEPLTSKPDEHAETLRDRLDSIEDKAEMAIFLGLCALILILLIGGEKKP